jgi:SAM-dependent methyltransferase
MHNKISIESFKCVVCGNEIVEKNDKKLYCINSNCFKYVKPYNLVQNKPVLINFELSLLNEDLLVSLEGESSVKRTKIGFMTKTRNLFRKKNQKVVKNVELLFQEMVKIVNPKILIVGGGEIGNGLDGFYKKFSNKITSFDIYNSPYVDFIADAHQIPIVNDYFDLVIVQAVLEHVLEPKMVVGEIWRVLKYEGVVYAETPFMQQVHEGQYDFLRFSESGHRYLFKNFSLIKSGHILGAATSLLWSLDYFFSGLLRSRLAGKVVKIFFFWLAYFDTFIPDSYNIDGASGVYFIGRKSTASLSANEIIMHYKGNQK